MTTPTRLALVAGLTLALAGCQRDQSLPLTGPRAAENGAVTPAPAPNSAVFTDADGNVYELVVVTDQSGPVIRHLRNGQIFAEVRSAAGGASISYFAASALLEEQLVSLQGGPADIIPITTTNLMAMPCQSELAGYAVASGQLIAAGLWVQRAPTNIKARAAFSAAAMAWAASWWDLHDCLHP